MNTVYKRISFRTIYAVIIDMITIGRCDSLNAMVNTTTVEFDVSLHADELEFYRKLLMTPLEVIKNELSTLKTTEEIFSVTETTPNTGLRNIFC